MIYPPGIPRGSVALQEHVPRPPVWPHGGIIEHLGDVTRHLRRGVPTRPVVAPGSHERVVVHAGEGRLPLDVTCRQDARVKVAVHEDGPVCVVPRPAEGAYALDLGLGGPVVGNHLRRVDVHAVLVGEGGVCALPGRDAAAAVAEGEGGLGDVERAEAVEEVRLAGHDDVVEVGIA